MELEIDSLQQISIQLQNEYDLKIIQLEEISALSAKLLGEIKEIMNVKVGNTKEIEGKKEKIQKLENIRC